MQITPDLDLKRLQVISLGIPGLWQGLSRMAQRCYIGIWKSAEGLNRAKGSPELALMLSHEPRPR
jgi:hypothetical protein